MPSSSRRAKGLLSLLVVAALTVTIRLPFLLHADRFFDSDEAVEGLMARHVSQGEWPAFLWGQRYKGVPEVYLNAALFAVVGPSVGALKATTLACFVLAVCLQFLLVEALFSRRVAWIASAFLIVGPPSLVLWTLSANAEVVLTLLAGAVLGLALVEWERSRSPKALAVAAASVGFGLWVHQYIVYYVVALGISLVWQVREFRAWLREIVQGTGLRPWLRRVTALVGVLAAVYFVLGLASFVTGGFDVTVGGVLIGMRNPQKLWRIGAALLTLFGVARFAGQLLQPQRRNGRIMAVAGVAGFLVGYAPVLIANRGSISLPLARMDAKGLVDATGTIVSYVVPMVLGFRSPLTEGLPVSLWFGWLLAAVVGVSLFALRQRGVSPYFHILLVVVPVVFLASGSYHDPQSYRYLMPAWAAIPVVLAVGIDFVAKWNRRAALTTFGALLVMFATQQLGWYRRLAPDTRSQAILECLTRNAVRGTFADYWLSYKITFLSGEQVIVAPNNGVDRYPPYTTYVQSLGEGDDRCQSLLLQ